MRRLRLYLMILLFSLVLPASALAVNTYYLPQAAVGSYGNLQYVTQISMKDFSAFGPRVSVSFLKDDGSPWTVTTSCVENPALNGDNSALSFFLSWGAKYAISMTSPRSIEGGWVVITSTSPLSLSATYGLYEKLQGTESAPVWEAAVLPSASAMRFSFPGHSRTDDVINGVDVNTAVAISNPNSVAVTVRLECVNTEGDSVGDTEIPLAPGSHTAKFMTELFSTLDLSNFRGTITLSATEPVAGLAMKEAKRGDTAVYSTLPVVPTSAWSVHREYDCEPNNDLNQAMALGQTLPSEVYGTISKGDDGIAHDRYRVELAVGQQLDVVLLAGALGSDLVPVLTLHDPNGAAVEAATDVFVRDRKLDHVAATAGWYTITVGAAEESHGSNSFYRMFVRAHF